MHPLVSDPPDTCRIELSFCGTLASLNKVFLQLVFVGEELFDDSSSKLFDGYDSSLVTSIFFLSFPLLVTVLISEKFAMKSSLRFKFNLWSFSRRIECVTLQTSSS